MKKNLFGLTVAFMVIIGSVTSVSAAYKFYPYEGVFKWPTVSQLVTSEFGDSRDGGKRLHKGVDIGPITPGANGDPLYAAYSGIVVRKECTSYGDVLTINHAIYDSSSPHKYIQTKYVHIKRNSELVDVGDRVSKGQKIAEMGGTGGYPVHLHYEMRVGENYNMDKKGRDSDPTNPLVLYTPTAALGVYALEETPELESDESLFVAEEKDTKYYDDLDVVGILKNNMIYSVERLSNLTYDELVCLNLTNNEVIKLLNDIKEEELENNYKKLVEQLNKLLK